MSSAHGHNGSHGDHERTDALSRPIASSLFGVLVLVALSMVLMGGLFFYFSERETVLDTTASPLESQQTPPAGPQLQSNPPADLAELRRQWDARANSYGWADAAGEQADPAQQVARIPVDKAIGLLLERGLPVRDAAAAR